MGDPAAGTAAITRVAATLAPCCAGQQRRGHGRARQAPFLDTDDRFVAHLVAVNFTGPFICSGEAARHMATRGGGVIINVGSIASHAAQQYASA